MRANFSKHDYTITTSALQDALNAHSGDTLKDTALRHIPLVDTAEDSIIQRNVKIQGLHSALTVKAALTKPGK